MMADRLGSKGEAQERCAVGSLPLVGADETGQAHVPAGFLTGFPYRRFQQAFLRLQMACRLVQHPASLPLLLDQQQLPVTRDHGRHGDAWRPARGRQWRLQGTARCAHCQYSSLPVSSSSIASALRTAASMASLSTSAEASASILTTNMAMSSCLTQLPSLEDCESSSRRLPTSAGNCGPGDL